MSFDTISIIGLGYIGLPTAAMFAAKQKRVFGVDVSEYVVDMINSGEIHIVEPRLEEVVNKAVTNGLLSASLVPQESDAFVIAVPTPIKPAENGVMNPDLSYVREAVSSISSVIKRGDLVVLESTSPVGTTEMISELISKLRPDLVVNGEIDTELDVKIAYCPERVLPGNVLHELVENDRVIGGLSQEAAEAAIELYKIFVIGDCTQTSARTAEMVKLTENSSRDVQIAFANELSVVCDELDINVWELISLANRHPRVNILQPGPGVGGHCIAVDPWFIISKSPKKAKLIKAARNINDDKPNWVVDKILSRVEYFKLKNTGLNSESITIACYGLAFKANIDDLRESPSLDIVRKISVAHPGKVIAVEPNITKLPSSDYTFELVNFDDAMECADIHVLLMDHKEFLGRDINIDKNLVVDTKGIWF